MVIVDDDDRSYLPSDLKCMDMLRHPVWVFDIDKSNMYWANMAAVKLFNATSRTELLLRDFKSEMSEASANLLQYLKANQLARNEHLTDQWVIFPNDLPPLKIHATGSAVRIEDGRLAFLVEAELVDSKRIIEENTIRNIEILKHLPIAVSQFSIDGTQLMSENPKASRWFGIPKANTTPVTESEADTLKVGEGHSDPTVLLLQRFVDVEAGREALRQVQNSETFSAELQQYILKETSCSKSENSDVKMEDKINDDDMASVGPNQQNEPTSTSSRTAEIVRMEKRWCNVMLLRTRDPVTSDYVLLYIARDISDLMQARRETEQAAIKSEFLNVVAHELRTPLHQIIGHTDLLVHRSELLDAEQLESLQQVQCSCSMLISIINDLLDCSKLENGQILAEHIMFDLDELLSSCVESIRPQALNKQLILEYAVDANITTRQLISDPNRLRQIIHNLLSNAIKFTATGCVELSVRAMDRIPIPEKDRALLSDAEQRLMLRFAVSDTGIGIDPNDQQLVFERYRQANASISRQFGGTGLGLPICKGLVELLGGKLSLQSTIGKGSVFTFDIPFGIASSKPAHVTKGLDSRTSTSIVSTTTEVLPVDSSSPIEAITVTTLTTSPPRMNSSDTCLNILVVEDNVVNQKVVRSMLQRLGHRVFIAENGQVALSTISQRHTNPEQQVSFFRIVLMDIHMPIMDGIECTKYIRNVLHFGKDDMPIIGLTASYQPSDDDFYIHTVGMNNCIGKPLRMKDLEKMIAYYCR